MKTSLEGKALAWAVAAALLSLGASWLGAKSVAAFTAGPVETTAAPEVLASPALVATGHDYYNMSCSHCHADDATGDEGPSLHNLTISNARIATTIKKGVKGEMPSFAKKYNDQQVAALVSYLRTLR